MVDRPHQSLMLRRTTAADVPLLHAMELDRASNELAGTKPRDWPTFHARGTEMLADRDARLTGVTPCVVLRDGVVIGAVHTAPQDGLDMLGYWIDRGYWGRSVVSAAAHHALSIRVLEKDGFRLVCRAQTPEAARTVARESVTRVLR